MVKPYEAVRQRDVMPITKNRNIRAESAHETAMDG
jgi:hypothetical protein